MFRIGHGFDVHKFGGSGPITLCGVKIDYQQGLIAHSDGDVALHALCDALLGAVALGDIGRHFPDSDPNLSGVDSRLLLKEVYHKVTAKGYQLSNLDLTIVAQAPKMAAYIEAMCQHLAQLFDCAIEQVNVKATTTEKLGYTGRKEGIACHAVVLLQELPDKEES